MRPADESGLVIRGYRNSPHVVRASRKGANRNPVARLPYGHYSVVCTDEQRPVGREHAIMRVQKCCYLLPQPHINDRYIRCISRHGKEVTGGREMHVFNGMVWIAGPPDAL